MSEVEVETSVSEAIPDICILDDAPERLNRLLKIISGKGYAATWIHFKKAIREGKDSDGNIVRLDPPDIQVQQELVIIRDDGVLFTNAPFPGSKRLNELDAVIDLADIPDSRLLWSGAGVNRFVQDDLPDAVSVFTDLCVVISSFMDFHGSFGAQEEMCKLIACFCLSTYQMDAFPVTGYLWPNGEPGSGKSHLLLLISVLSYLGQFITAGGSFASIRDISGYGATLCFDDAERIMDKNGNPDKQALLLAGNRKGTTIPYKVYDKDKKWVTRQVEVYCPKCFSAVSLPIDTLASRTIFIPLLASDDSQKSNSDPLDVDSWPVDRKKLIDDMWALSLVNLNKMSDYDKQASAHSGMSGRAYQPWRAIMATALWLDEEGCTGLFDCIKGLTKSYGEEQTFGADSHKTVVLKALRRIVDNHPKSKGITFATKTLKSYINSLAIESDLMYAKTDRDGNQVDYINSRSLGKRLRRMRLRRPEGRNANVREWVISEAELERLEKTSGIPSTKTSQTSETV